MQNIPNNIKLFACLSFFDKKLEFFKNCSQKERSIALLALKQLQMPEDNNINDTQFKEMREKISLFSEGNKNKYGKISNVVDKILVFLHLRLLLIQLLRNLIR